MAPLSRTEKEQRYITAMQELQRLWQNPVPLKSEFDFTEWTDEQLDKGLSDISGQLRFEKAQNGIVKVISFAIMAFVGLGIIGLLLFGIRQLVL